MKSVKNDKRFLFLDDVRTPFAVANYILPIELREQYRKEPWFIVRDYTEFVNYIKIYGIPDVVSFDHDLHQDHYNEQMFINAEEYNKLYDTFQEKTGLNCVRYLLEQCINQQYCFPESFCHSMNPVGKNNILSVIKQGYEFNKIFS